MPDLIIQPTAKFIKAGAIVTALVIAGLDLLYYSYASDLRPWLLAAPVLLFLWPASRQLRRQFTKASITGDRLRYESGMTSRSTRNIQLSKIQDVRVDQAVMQRIFGVGNLSIETAGESSRLVLLNVDKPQELADEIMNRVPKGGGV